MWRIGASTASSTRLRRRVRGARPPPPAAVRALRGLASGRARYGPEREPSLWRAGPGTSPAGPAPMRETLTGKALPSDQGIGERRDPRPLGAPVSRGPRCRLSARASCRRSGPRRYGNRGSTLTMTEPRGAGGGHDRGVLPGLPATTTITSSASPPVPPCRRKRGRNAWDRWWRAEPTSPSRRRPP